jgi:hypothetical protein
LSAVKKIQIEDKYDMLDSDDDVLSLDDEEISITIVLMSEVYPWDKIIGLSLLTSLMAINQLQKLLNVVLPSRITASKEKGTKAKELSTITLAYMKNKRPDQADQKQKLKVLFDPGCSIKLR